MNFPCAAQTKLLTSCVSHRTLFYREFLGSLIVQRPSAVIILFPFFSFILCAFLFWPGLMRPDSLVQMQQGIAGSFSDHHPPMMSFVFGLFDKLFRGSGPMFLFHLALYWGAVSLFARAEIHKAKWVYWIAFLPPVFAYQLLVLKDISFVNAYLFCAAWLHFYSMRDLSPSLLSLLGWLVIAFYGTCCTYQAIIALPWLCLWFAKFYSSDRSKKWMITGLVMFGVIMAGAETFNRTMSTPSNRSQHTKLYDLTGISAQLNDPIFPEYIKQNTTYDFEQIKELYNANRVDDLTYPMATNAQDQLDVLYSTWIRAVFFHPIAYLKHRWSLFYQQLTVSLLKKPSDIKGEVSPPVLKILGWVESSGVFTLASWLMAYIVYFFIQLAYIAKGYKQFNEHPKYVSLFFQNIMGMSLVLSLFFIAGAAEARYAYIAIAMFHFSHPFLLHEAKPSRFTGRRFG